MCVCVDLGPGATSWLSPYLGQLSWLKLWSQDGGENALVSLAGLQELREPFDWSAEAPRLAPPPPLPPFPLPG